jgi:hypothetical protein
MIVIWSSLVIVAHPSHRPPRGESSPSSFALVLPTSVTFLIIVAFVFIFFILSVGRSRSCGVDAVADLVFFSWPRWSSFAMCSSWSDHLLVFLFILFCYCSPYLSCCSCLHHLSIIVLVTSCDLILSCCWSLVLSLQLTTLLMLSCQPSTPSSLTNKNSLQKKTKNNSL